MFDDPLPPYYRLINVWWLPSLKMKKFRVPFPENRKWVDRYEIHIQAFLLFINGKLIIFNPHLRKNILINIYAKYVQKLFPENSKNMFQRKWRVYLSKISKNLKLSDPQISKNNIVVDDSIFFLYSSSHFGDS